MFRFVIPELLQGLRRNITMHVAVILTLFVSLTLVGVGLIMAQQAEKAEEYWGSQLEITVYLCKDGDDNPGCVGEVTKAQEQALIKTIEENPEVDSYRKESKADAFEKVKELFGKERFEGPNPPATVDAMRKSVWIELENPDKYEGITSAVNGLDGVASVRDMRDRLKPVFGAFDVLQWGSILAAVVLVMAAVLMVGNTTILAAHARRKELGIMRLVGAGTLNVALPFLLEALVTAIVGIALTAGGLALFVFYGIGSLESRINFIPWVGGEAYLWSVIAVAILAPILTLVPTLILLTTKYVRV